MDIISKLKWFLGQDSKNQVIAILIVLLGLSIFDKQRTQTLQKEKDDKHISLDSIRSIRYNNDILRWQNDYKALQEQRILEKSECYEAMQKQSEEFFKVTDKMYHELYKR